MGVLLDYFYPDKTKAEVKSRCTGNTTDDISSNQIDTKHVIIYYYEQKIFLL